VEKIERGVVNLASILSRVNKKENRKRSGREERERKDDNKIKESKEKVARGQNNHYTTCH
jgi:hypothetical protein